MARDKRTLKKVNKVMVRVEKHIEQTRDALEDLEIEFEVLKATVKRLKEQPLPAEEAAMEEVDEEMPVEHTSSNCCMVEPRRQRGPVVMVMPENLACG